MSISVEYCYSSLTAGKLLSEATLLLSLVVRWLLFPWYCLWPSSLWSSASFLDDAEGAESRARHSVAAQAVRDNLHVSTYGELVGEGAGAGAGAGAATCAVCLSEVRRRDSVWELTNCRHVFHRGCLDRWLDHDEHLTCPLCRAPLLGELARLPCASAAQASNPEPSWAVERLLYLFGDDLLFAPAC